MAPRIDLRLALGALGVLAACETSAPAAEPLAVAEPALMLPAAPPAEAPIEAVPMPSAPATVARGREIEIPAGTLRAGSPTGTRERNPSSEADDVSIALGAFHIDALPYPNDPALPPRGDVNRSEAGQLCAAEGKRLCSELEWERACKGDENLIYPAMSHDFDPAGCKADLNACQSPFGVFALGALGREWTSSDTTRGLGDSLRTAVVRGASTSAAVAQHRCAARDAATPDSKSGTLIFRCCRGAANKATYPDEAERPPFVEKALPPQALASLLKSLPAMREVAEQFRLFSAADFDLSLQAAHSSRARMAPWVAAPAALAWSPVHGEEVLVLTGDTPRGALLIAMYALADGRYSLIGSLESAREHTPFVVAYKPDAPRELLFSTCWGCGGEGGALTLGEDARVTLEPR